jgi:hypothetical protein
MLPCNEVNANHGNRTGGALISEQRHEVALHGPFLAVIDSIIVEVHEKVSSTTDGSSRRP